MGITTNKTTARAMVLTTPGAQGFAQPASPVRQLTPTARTWRLARALQELDGLDGAEQAKALAKRLEGVFLGANQRDLVRMDALLLERMGAVDSGHGALVRVQGSVQHYSAQHPTIARTLFKDPSIAVSAARYHLQTEAVVNGAPPVDWTHVERAPEVLVGAFRVLRQNRERFEGETARALDAAAEETPDLSLKFLFWFDSAVDSVTGWVRSLFPA